MKANTVNHAVIHSSRTFFLVTAMLLVPTSLQAGTILGLHGAIGAPEIADSVGARMVRGIVSDWDFALGGERFFTNMRDFKQRGFETVVALRWPTDPDDSRKTDRIPTDKVAALDLLEQFLLETHGLVDWFQIQNEPLGGPGKYEPTQRQAGLQWLNEVAARARQVIDEHQLNTRIVSPGITGLEAPLRGVQQGFIIEGIDAIIEMGRDYADAIDIHLHVEDADDLVARVAYVESRMDELNVAAELTTLEWSQADIMDAHFDDHPDDLQFVKDSYDNPRTAEEWAAFMQTLPLDERFMPEAYDLLDQRGFVHAAYGGLWQFGNPKFDVKALMANKTVDAMGNPLLRRNEPIISWYSNLAASLIPEPSSWLLAICAAGALMLSGRQR